MGQCSGEALASALSTGHTSCKVLTLLGDLATIGNEESGFGSKPSTHYGSQLLALLGDLFACLFNLLFSCQKQQDVPWGLAGVDLHHCPDRSLKVVALWLLRVRDE